MVDRLTYRKRRPRTPWSLPLVMILLVSLLMSPFMSSVVPTFTPPSVYAAGRVYVDAANTGTQDGTTWATAHSDLQNALDNLECNDVDGCEIWVAEGTYTPSKLADSGDSRTATFSLTNQVQLYGGFAGDETTLDERDWGAHETILSGDIGVSGEPTDNAYHVVTGSYADIDAVLDGFTITDGYNESGSGAGVYIEYGGPQLRNVKIVGNTAGDGGGVYNDQSTTGTSLVNVIFLDNDATGGPSSSGGAVYNTEGAIAISNGTFVNNRSVFNGGAISNESAGELYIYNGLFVANSSEAGGAIYNAAGAIVGIEQSTFSHNTATTAGYALRALNSAQTDFSIENSILWDNGSTTNENIDGSTDIQYSIVQGGCPTSSTCAGVLNTNPQFFRDPDPGADGEWNTDDDDYGDLHLRDVSPAIDAGSNDLLGGDTYDLDSDGDTDEDLPLDLDSNPRQIDYPVADTGVGTPPIVDMGAFEAQVQGIAFDPASDPLSVSEAGETSTSYDIKLDSAIWDDVTIDIVTDGQTTVQTPTLVFTPDDWHQSQTVTITAVDDRVAEGSHTSTIEHRATSNDTAYDGKVEPLTVNVNDNDTSAIGVQESGGKTEVVEGSANPDRYDLWLTSQPTDSVQITPNYDENQLSVSPDMLVFTSENWQEPQTFQVSALNDGTTEGDHESLITHDASSNDADYASSDVAPVTVVVHDAPTPAQRTVLPSTTDNEPNDNMNQCQWLGPGFQGPTLAADPESWLTSVEGTIDTEDEIDWYKFEINQPDSVVAITLTNLPADYDLVLGRFSPFPGVEGEEIDDGLLDIVNLSSVKSSRAMSSRAMSSRAMSSRAMSSRAMSSRAMSSRAMSSRAMSSRAMSSRAMSSRAMSSRAMSSRAMSSGRFTEILGQVEDINGTVTAVSMELGQTDEVIETGLWFPGVYYVAVVNNNGEYSDEPYTLEIEVEGSGIDPVQDSLFITDGSTPDETVKTLFIFNGERMKEMYPDQTAEVDEVLANLQMLAARSDVNGRILMLDSSAGASAVSTLYDDWATDPANPFLANRLAETIDNRITAATLYNPSNLRPGDDNYIGPPYPNVEYIVLVGGDSIIPFYRLPDLAVLSNEADYYAYIAGAVDDYSSLAGSLFFGTTLTDNIYGSDHPYDWPSYPLYIPDRAVGRLVESPTEILAYLDQYIYGSDTSLVIDGATENQAAVTGYDFLADQGWAIKDQLLDLGLNVDYLIDDPDDPDDLVWTNDDLTALIFDSQYGAFGTPSYTVHSPLAYQSINAHFDHFQAIPSAADGVPDAPVFYAETILTPTVASGQFALYFQNRLVYSIGCHSGLNVEDHTMLSGIQSRYLADFPQAFNKQGGNFIGNTGYGYGDTEKLAYGEDLLLQYTQELGRNVTDDSGSYTGQPIGIALVNAKQRYMSGLSTVDTLDVKTVLQTTLYGLPFIRAKVPSPVDLPDLPPQTADRGARNSYGITERTISFTLEEQDNGDAYPDMVVTNVQDSFVPDGETPTIPDVLPATREGVPELPKFVYDLTASNQNGTNMMLKNVILTGASYQKVTDYEPRITWVVTREQVSEAPIFPNGVGVWYPDIFFNVSSTIEDDKPSDQLLVIPTQYQGENEDGTQGTLRTYTNVTFKVLYLDPDAPDADDAQADNAPPIISRVDIVATSGNLQATDARLVVTVKDAPESPTGLPSDGVYGVYEVGDQGLQSVDFSQPDPDGRPNIWTADIVGTSASEVRYIVTAIDNAGNTTVYNGKGSATLEASVPLSAITINGPSESALNATHTLTTTLQPFNATQPVSYTWSPTPASGQGTRKVSYTFTTIGQHTITVSAVEPSTGDVVSSRPLVVTVANDRGQNATVYLPLITR